MNLCHDSDRPTLPYGHIARFEMSALRPGNGDTLVGSVNGVRRYESFVSNYIDPLDTGYTLLIVCE